MLQSRQKIPNFSKLHNIRIPLRFFELFFDYALVDMIICYTKLYGHREKVGTSFEIANETFRLFLDMPLLSRCHKLPDRKMYWEATPDTFLQAMSDLMPRYKPECILRNLILCNSQQLDKTDELWKLRPVINELYQ